jgi:protein-L-isoaspartate O-methyltransferase
MLIPVGSRDSQDLIMVRKEGFAVTEEVVKGECTFVPLLGQFAWKSDAGS